jgi:chitodextrinase
LIPIVIPKDNFIEGNATFKYTMTSNGNCYVYLTISQDSEPPSASTLTATATSSSRIDLSWTECTDNKGVAGYKIHDSNGTPLRTVNGTSTYFDNLTPNTQYCYTVTAHDAAGNESVHSNQACATTFPEGQDTAPPSVPTGLTADAISESQINLSWGASSDNVGVAGYKIYRNGSYLKAGSSISATDTQLSSQTQYCYTVSSYDEAMNESSQSSQACATTLIDTSPPNPPTGLTLTTGIDGSHNAWIRATWNANVEPDFAFYELKIKVEGGNYVFMNSATNEILLSPVITNTRYYVGVRAVDWWSHKSSYCPDVSIVSALD